ncbi:MAG: putative lipid II flippase FtsW, partial [Patescibacteria group bacterium]
IAYSKFHNSYYYLIHQFLNGFLPGIVVFFIASRIKYTFWKKSAFGLLIFALVLMLAVFIPGIGMTTGTANSWINIFGFSFQPSELLKLALIIYFASFFSKSENKVDDFNNGFLPFLLVFGVSSILLILQPDIGTLSIVAAIVIALYFVAGANIKHLAGLCLLGLAGVGVLIKIAPYRLNRLTAFLDPSKDPLGIGYHINQALIAVGSGGFFGVGLGQSKQKFAYLPEVYCDSVFAVIGEEMGFLVSLILVGLFVFLVMRGFKIAQESSDEFARLTAFGISFWFVFQAIINIMSMIALMPMTGVPLTFISYGGSAMMLNLLAAGILINISKYTTR